MGRRKGKGFFPRPKELQFCGLVEENQPKKEDRKLYRKIEMNTVKCVVIHFHRKPGIEKEYT